jgi:hypothetical protein
MLKISFELQYTKCELAPKQIERKPICTLYLSNQFERSASTGGVVNIHLDEDNLTKTYKGTLTGKLRPEYAKIPPVSAIGIASFAIHTNDKGFPCYVNVGTSHAFMRDVLSEKTKYEHEHPLMMRTVIISDCPPVEKGVVKLKVTKVETALKLAAQSECALTSAPVELIERSILDPIRQSMELEYSLPDTIGGTERIRAPMNLSQVGIEFTGNSFLPAASFAIMETPIANSNFFVNAFNECLARRKMRPSAYHDFDLKEKARLLGQILCYPVQSNDYIGDAVERSSRLERGMKRLHIATDEWSNGLVTTACDCEDGALAICSIKSAFLNTDFAGNEALHELQQLCKNHYIVGMSLAVVHGAKIGDQEGHGAHMYTPMLTRAQFYNGLKRTKEGREFLKLAHGPDAEQDGKVPLPVSGPAGNRDSPPSMFGEGTGHIDPLGYDDPLLAQRRYIAMHMESMKGYNSEIPHKEQGESPFYMASLLFITDEFFNQGLNVGAFIMGQANPNYDSRDPSNQHQMTRGVMFTDLLMANDNLAIIPYPRISDAAMQIARESMALAPPVRELTISSLKPNKPLTCPLWDKVVAYVRGLGRVGDKTKGSVDKFVRLHQYNEEQIGRIMSDISRLDRIYDVDYRAERITDTLHVWRVELYVN